MKSATIKGKIINSKPSNRFKNNEFNNPICKTIKYPSCEPKSFTKSNLNGSLQKLIVESNESEDNAVVTEDSEDNKGSTLLVDSATSHKSQSWRHE